MLQEQRTVNRQEPKGMAACQQSLPALLVHGLHSQRWQQKLSASEAAESEGA